MTKKQIKMSAVILLLILISVQTVFSNIFSDRSPAEITVSGREEISYLIKLKLIIDNVNKGSVTAYLTPEEFSSLQANGYTVQWIPDESKTAHALYFSLKTKNITKEGDLSYPTYDELTSDLETIAAQYPAICKLESAGLSVEGRQLWWLKISDNVHSEEAEPETHFISTIHGDEPVGTVLCLAFISYLTSNYSTDPRIKSLIDNTEIWIMPLMNPDGYSEGERWNANGLDLNRSFPSFSFGAGDELTSTAGREPEVSAIMQWALDHTSVLSANFHAGALVVNYPFDYTEEISPDNDLFEYISLQYSASNTPMYNSYDPVTATNGIVRGVDWYQIEGGMQDWTYLATGGNQVTIELSSVKMPQVSTLPELWDDNRESMLAYIETVHCGVKGIITDSDSEEPLFASITIDGNSHPVYTDPDLGDYHRMLLPGIYTVTIEADGYTPFSKTITISENTVSELDAQLEASENDGSCFIFSTIK